MPVFYLAAPLRALRRSRPRQASSVCLAVVLCLSLGACSNFASPSPAVNGPDAPELASLAQPTPVVLSVAYRDDFRDQASGWDDVFDANTMRQYGAHRYRIEVRSPNLLAWGLANRNISDFVLEVKAWQEDGPPNSSYGVLFRYQDKDNFYRYDITGDGFFSVSKVAGGRWLTLVGWTASPAIHHSGQENHLRISCLGEEIRVFANGSLLAGVRDDSYRQGDIGFFGTTYDQAGAQVSFDDLAVWTPPGAQVVQRGGGSGGGTAHTGFTGGSQTSVSVATPALPAGTFHAAPQSDPTVVLPDSDRETTWLGHSR